MKILLLAGTSDARMLAKKLIQEGYDITATVVTENAAVQLRNCGINVQVGRLTASEIISLIVIDGFQVVVDASHPFAEEASKNAICAAKDAKVPYIRYERESQLYSGDKLIYAKDYVEAAEIAAQKRGTIFLTTGGKTLQIFTEKLLHLPNTRLLARMLPRKDNMEKCEQLGLPQKNIVAIQGPFTKEFNKALFQQYEVTLMITKESGQLGSVDEKLEAAMELGIEVIMIKRPDINYGTSFSNFSGVLQQLRTLNNEKGAEKT